MTLDQYLIYKTHQSLADSGREPTYERVLDWLISLKYYAAAEAVLRRMENKGHALGDLDMDVPTTIGDA